MGINDTGNNNSVLGCMAMRTNTTGSGNCAVGASAMFSITTGNSNVGVGGGSLYGLVSGEGNVAIGSGCLSYCASGEGNVAVGPNAGLSITTGSNNIAIGAGADVAEAAEDNQINVGNCILRNGPRKNVSVRAGSAAYANSSDTEILDLANLRGWVGFVDDGNGWCRLRVNPAGISIEASSADWVASATPASGEVGLYVSSGELHMVLGSAATRTIGFTDQTMSF